MLHENKQEINEANVKKVLTSAGVSVDETKVKALITALDGVNIDEAIKQSAVVAAAPAASAGEAKKEEVKDEKTEEKKEEEAAAGLASLFG